MPNIGIAAERMAAIRISSLSAASPSSGSASAAIAIIAGCSSSLAAAIWPASNLLPFIGSPTSEPPITMSDSAAAEAASIPIRRPIGAGSVSPEAEAASPSNSPITIGRFSRSSSALPTSRSGDPPSRPAARSISTRPSGMIRMFSTRKFSARITPARSGSTSSSTG